MPEQIKNSILRWQFLWKLLLLAGYAWFRGIRFNVYSMYRTPEQQNMKYRVGRTLPGSIQTNCDGYKVRSMHQRWRAADIVVLAKDGSYVWEHVPEYDVLGKHWERLGGTWLGTAYKEGRTSFDDCYHLEF